MCAQNVNENYYPAIDAEIGRNGYNVTSFSRAINIERGTYYNWQENGKIPATKLIEIARLFHCTTDYLLGLDDNIVRVKTPAAPSDSNTEK